MLQLPRSVQKLVNELSKLPSIGSRTAQRLAYFIVNSDPKIGKGISAAIEQAISAVRKCQRCGFICDTELCEICADAARDTALLCVVEKPSDVIAMERSGEYRGYYHVLHGVWAPLKGQGADSMTIPQLIARTESGVSEVILATSATVEGDATALYISKILGARGIKNTRIAQGIPKGGELEFADDLTLARAFKGRAPLNPS